MDSGLAASRRPGMTRKDCAANVIYEETGIYGVTVPLHLCIVTSSMGKASPMGGRPNFVAGIPARQDML